MSMIEENRFDKLFQNIKKRFSADRVRGKIETPINDDF